MLQKQFRLPIGLHGRSTSFITTQYFTLRSWKNDISHNRFGFVVSKKVDKRAVARNRVKRVVRACVENNKSYFAGNNDMLFFLKKEAGGAPPTTICEVVASSLGRLLKTS